LGIVLVGSGLLIGSLLVSKLLISRLLVSLLLRLLIRLLLIGGLIGVILGVYPLNRCLLRIIMLVRRAIKEPVVLAEYRFNAL
jgi:hypothetical protein